MPTDVLVLLLVVECCCSVLLLLLFCFLGRGWINLIYLVVVFI